MGAPSDIKAANMKTSLTSVAGAITVAFLFGCGHATVVPPVQRDVIQAPTSETRVSEAKATPPQPIAAPALPQITSINGVTISDAGISDGMAAMDCGQSYNGYRVVNDAPGVYPWTVSGANFGPSKGGTVTLNGQPVPVINWQTTAIKLDPTLPWGSTAGSMLLQIRTAAGSQVTKSVLVAPAISTRIYGQCTYLVALIRHQMMKTPSSTAYGGYSALTASYVPRAGDQYQWTWSGGKHAAIATAVSSSQKAGVVTYAVTIQEMNVDCKNGTDNFVAQFAVSGKTIATQLKHPKLGVTTLYYR